MRKPKMRENGTMSSLIAVGTREEVMRSWLESEERTLAMLSAHFKFAVRVGRQQEAAEMYGEYAARVTEYERRRKELGS